LEFLLLPGSTLVTALAIVAKNPVAAAGAGAGAAGAIVELILIL
jgi:hypothetical protein